jgi:hypothetical protein
VVELQDLVGDALDLRVGGTYDVAVDPSGKRIYMGVNAGPARPSSEDEDDTFGTIVLVVIDLP